MDTVVSSAHGSKRGNQDETPFPLEFEIVAGRKRVVHREGRSQDETAPFPLEFEVVARKARQSVSRDCQDETSPFLLEFMVVLPDGASAFVRTARPPRAPGARRSSRRGLPHLKWHGVDASVELREYAARIAAGESLPPFRGPILANGESPSFGRAVRHSTKPAATDVVSATTADDSKAFVKLTLALLVMSALVVASAVLGSDAQLRHVGESISEWFTGRGASSQMLHQSEPAPSPAYASSSSQR